MRPFLVIICILLIAHLVILDTVFGFTWSSALVTLAAFGTVFGLWKYKKSLGPEAWGKSRIVLPKIVKPALGICIFAVSLMAFGQELRTMWEIHLGRITPDPELPDPVSSLLVYAIMCGLGLALLGFEKSAGAFIAGTFFSVFLAGAFLFNSTWSSTAIIFTYIVAFITVFMTGYFFRWSKGFYLAGLLAVLFLGLKAYLTM